MRLLFALIASASWLVGAQPFSAQRTSQDGVEVAVLTDISDGTEVRVVPSLGNRAISFRIHGANVLYFPFDSLSSALAHPGLNGIPFLAPWANRLDESGFWADDQHYTLDPTVSNVQKDGNGLPIHGLLSTSKLWTISALAEDKTSARVTSRLEFWRYPELMAQWPFAEEYEMSYILTKEGLQVETRVTNRSAASMPIVIGFHPYYRIPGEPRDNWTVQIPAHKAVLANKQLIPTGEYGPLPFSNPLSLRGRRLDDGFADLQRDAQGRANFTLQAGARSLHISFGPKYPVAILWNPPVHGGPDNEFMCIEPMTGVTDAINLHHAGKYAELQVVPPGQTWSESFWIQPEGFH